MAGKPKINIDIERAKHLYLVDKLSLREIAEKFNVSASLIRVTLKKIGVQIRNRCECKVMNYNSNIFDKIDERWKAYFLGWIWSDGNLYKDRITLRLQEQDKCILDFFNNKIFNGEKNLTYFDCPIIKNTKTNKTYIGKPQYQLQLSNKFIADKLREIGLYPNKSLTIGYPKLTNFHADFIRGVFEGDGSVNLRFNRFLYFQANICGNKTLLTDIMEILKSNGVNLHLFQEKENLWKIYTPNKNAFIKFYQFMYPDDCFSLIRKREKFETAIEYWKIHNRVIPWPELTKLQDLINNKTYVEVAKDIGVHWKTLVSYLKKNGVERIFNTKTNLKCVYPKGNRFFYRFRFNNKFYEKSGFLTMLDAARAYDQKYFEITGKMDKINFKENLALY